MKYSDSDIVHIIRSKRNGGYGYGNNVGMVYSEKMKPEYFFILSNDTVIEKNKIKKLVDHKIKK